MKTPPIKEKIDDPDTKTPSEDEADAELYAGIPADVADILRNINRSIDTIAATIPQFNEHLGNYEGSFL